MKKLLWLTPESRGGIRSYSEALWPEVRKAWQGDALHPVFELLEPAALREMKPDLIHIQHEFGLFGSKIPGFYRFPKWLKQARKVLPHARFVATAHTVLPKDYVYPWRDRGWQTPLRWMANHSLVPVMRPFWREKTWGALDGVIVHSQDQVREIQSSGCSRVVEIPHFVPIFSSGKKPNVELPTILVFGFITPEKGQDIVIRAFAEMKTQARLILAGGARRAADQAYLGRCHALVNELGLGTKVKITGFLPDSELGSYYDRADLVVAPFRETSGSGSLAQALGRGAAILASDLPLNREIEQRQTGLLAFFPSENVTDCAAQMDRLLSDPGALERLSQEARAYALTYSLPNTAQRHVEFYRLLNN